MNSPAFHIVDLITTDEDKRFEPAGRMAAAIIRIVQKKGKCKPRDLASEGFSEEEVKTNWHMAQSLAAVELKLMSEKD